jgi:hypothetical protein
MAAVDDSTIRPVLSPSLDLLLDTLILPHLSGHSVESYFAVNITITSKNLRENGYSDKLKVSTVNI